MPIKIIFNVLAVCMVLALTSVMAAELVIIAHPGVSTDVVDQKDLKGFYLNKVKSWSDGVNVTIVVNTNDAVQDPFLDTYVGKNAKAFSSHWKRIVFTGKGAMPSEAATDAEVIALVAATPGSVSYIDKASVTDAVKVIQVQ